MKPVDILGDEMEIHPEILHLRQDPVTFGKAHGDQGLLVFLYGLPDKIGVCIEGFAGEDLHLTVTGHGSKASHPGNTALNGQPAPGDDRQGPRILQRLDGTPWNETGAPALQETFQAGYAEAAVIGFLPSKALVQIDGVKVDQEPLELFCLFLEDLVTGKITRDNAVNGFLYGLPGPGQVAFIGVLHGILPGLDGITYHELPGDDGIDHLVRHLGALPISHLDKGADLLEGNLSIDLLVREAEHRDTGLAGCR